MAPATTGVWTLRVRTGPFANTPPTGRDVNVTSNGNGRVGPVTLN